MIVVDDGSDDDTVRKAKESDIFKTGALSVVRNETNSGKGFAVKAGILKSAGKYVLFSDADSSTPIDELDKMLEYIGDDVDIVIGSRSVPDSDVRVPQPWHREKMGKIFNFCVRALLVDSFKDTQCGFKLFKGDIAREIARLSEIKGFCFDVEMLYIAGQKGYRVREVGVVWNNSIQSKVKILNSSLSMFLDLLRIKKIHK